MQIKVIQNYYVSNQKTSMGQRCLASPDLRTDEFSRELVEFHFIDWFETVPRYYLGIIYKFSLCFILSTTYRKKKLKYKQKNSVVSSFRNPDRYL